MIYADIRDIMVKDENLAVNIPFESLPPIGTGLSDNPSNPTRVFKVIFISERMSDNHVVIWVIETSN